MREKKENSKGNLQEAVQKEISVFEEFYHWLEKSMPPIFFEEVTAEWIPLIVHALTAFKLQDYFSRIHLKQGAIVLCLDSPEADVAILKNYPMYGIKDYTTYVSQYPLPFPEKPLKLRIAILNFTFVQEKGIDQMDSAFLRKMNQEHQTIALELFERAQSRDQCQYAVEKINHSIRIILAWKNTPKHNFLYRLARVVYRHNLMMHDVVASYIKPYTTHSILMLSFTLDGTGDIEEFLQEIVLLKYFGSFDLIDQTFVEPKLIRGTLGNFLRSAINFVHQVLVNVDPNLYSLENIFEDFCRHPELTVLLTEAFESKFSPKKVDLKKYEQSSQKFYELCRALDTGQEMLDQRRKNVLLQAMNFVSHILKTNFYRKNKASLIYRMDPNYLNCAPFDRERIFPELPFAIFFTKGMHFLAFHIRFKDLARGGLRTVYASKKESVLAERNTVFNECYNLAYTQHKKNKDIPEGGAKGVIFLKPYERLQSEAEIYRRELQEAKIDESVIEKQIDQFLHDQKLEYLYQTQRSFVKSFLSLINCNADGSLKAKDILDYYKKPEYIYLGPDENMHDSMIEWIAAESTKQDYRPKGAFISGKPSLGINHKEYGVTSLGVNVCMHELLCFLKLDPENEPFTVKMTGGPDGDVAGNQIYNLYRYYPKTAKLLALTDVSGTIYDPKGLDLEIGVELFRKGLSIRHYPPEKLSLGGFLLDREKRREASPYVQQTLCWRHKKEGVVADWLSGSEMNALFRNNVHQVKADIFIPCGGRPKTLGDYNYKEFLDDQGVPTAKGIVEGANLYLTPRAREQLEKLNVLIIKDSTANKCGVICSSFEILCGLALTDEEFLEHKKVLVGEILERLKKVSLDETRLLLQTHQESQLPLSQISDEISKRINYFTDQLLDHLESIELAKSPKDPFVNCYLHYCLKTLKESFENRLLIEIPENHKKAIIASHIASRLVYAKGLQWFPSLVDILPLILQDKEIFN